MTINTALEKYTKAMNSRAAFIEAHKETFDAHEKIVLEIVDAENELRDEVAAAKTGISNDSFDVVVTPQTQIFVDPEALKTNQGKTLTPELIEVLIVKTERPPRISIKAKK